MRALFLALALALALAPPAAAEVLTMRVFDATNLHMADQRGARNWSQDITVTVDLGAKGRASVAVKGKRRDHSMDVFDGRSYNTDDVTTWTTSWKGTYKRTKDSLVLDLALGKDTCTAVRDEEGTQTTKTCKAARNAVMRCTSTTVDLEIGTKKQSVAAWQCASDDTRDVGESPATWWLGKNRCIEVHAGRMSPLSFGACRS
jgi:hypothetical protein